jgi:hypothetical protein
LKALSLSLRVIIKWKRAITAPSNSVPRPVLSVVGENAFQMIVSQMLVAMKREKGRTLSTSGKVSQLVTRTEDIGSDSENIKLIFVTTLFAF